MIKALSTPASNKLILDGNSTLIRIQSTNGEGYYFRAKIYVNDTLFDEQGWSRSDAYTAEKDIKRLCEAYFTPEFKATFVNGITQQTHLVQKVKIVIEEYSLEDSQKVDELELPVFSVMYNILPEAFTDTVKIRILGVDPEVMVLPVNGKIAIPFFVNSANENISATLETDSGTAIDSFVSPAKYTGKRVFLYQFNLVGTDINSTVSYLRLTVRTGFSTASKIFRINHYPAFPFKEIAFRNNFGYYIYAYPAGEMEAERTYDIDFYETSDGRQKASAINQETTYTINSGNYSVKEKAIIGQIAASVDPKININVNSASNVARGIANWQDMLPKTKKHTFSKDKQHSFSDELVFSVRSGTSVANTGMITVEPAQPDIVITRIDIIGRDGKIYFTLNNGFSSPNIRLQYRFSNSTNWFTIPIKVANPIDFKFSPSSYVARLIDWNDQTNVSNFLPFTIE